ncbi:MAG: hypothetical protein KKH68_14445 [Proteobacteria bacterium]|nr:hypothetical protein [Pseudomonadota bacterium]
MTKKNDFTEKRKCKRFKAQQGAFAVLRPGYNMLGQIKDIGKDGLAFFYNTCGETLAGSFELDIFFIEEDFYLKKIPVKTVNDYKVENKVSLGVLPMKQLCMQFGELNSNQKLLLDFFIKKYTCK